MSETHATLLAKKIERSSIDTSIYPHLTDLTDRIIKLTSSELSRATQTSVATIAGGKSMSDGKGIIDGMRTGTAYYWIANEVGEEVVLVTLDQKLVSSLSECLLGAGFSIPPDDTKVEALDIEVARLFIKDIAPVLGVCTFRNPSEVGNAQFHISRAIDTPREAIKSKYISMLYTISLVIKIADAEYRDLMAIHFPVEILERNGFLEIEIQAQGDDMSQWSLDMHRNIMSREIDLPIILMKMETTVGDLSRLEVNQIIPVEDDAQNALEISIETKSGLIGLGTGRLGVLKENKAVKVSSELKASM